MQVLHIPLRTSSFKHKECWWNR